VAGSNNCIHNLVRLIPIGIAIADSLKKGIEAWYSPGSRYLALSTD